MSSSYNYGMARLKAKGKFKMQYGESVDDYDIILIKSIKLNSCISYWFSIKGEIVNIKNRN